MEIPNFFLVCLIPIIFIVTLHLVRKNFSKNTNDPAPISCFWVLLYAGSITLAIMMLILVLVYILP